jgi:hypothetical protein
MITFGMRARNTVSLLCPADVTSQSDRIKTQWVVNLAQHVTRCHCRHTASASGLSIVDYAKAFSF